MNSERDDGENAVLGQIGREFRNPLTVSLGALEAVLGRSDVPRDVLEHVQTVHRNNMTLLRLFNGIIDLNLVETGRARNRLEQTDVAQLTLNITDDFAKAAADRGIRFERKIEDTGIVYIDQDKWSKIVLNLLMYAFSLTFDGEVTLELSRKGDKLHLLVDDTSPGVPDDQLPKLFEAFYEIELGDGRRREGLGLALVKQFAEKLSGTVTAKSTVGKGTCFIVEIPTDLETLSDDSVALGRLGTDITATAAPYINELRKWQNADMDTVDISSNVVGIEALRIDRPAVPKKLRPRLLIVEDNVDLRNFLDQILAANYEIRYASGGNEAISRLRADEEIDLVVVEQILPDMDGREVIATIRRDPALQPLPVLMLTDRSTQDLDQVMRDVGADDYRVKPFAKFEMLAAVRNILEKTRLREENEAALRQAQRMEAIGLISGGIAHDFSNLLVAIIGNVELATRRVEDADVKRLLRNALQAAGRGKKLTSHLQAFSAERPPQIKALDANDVITSMGDLLSKALGGMSGVSTRLGKALWPTKADAGALELALLNLAINAREAMPNGGDVTIETVNVPQRTAPGAEHPLDYIRISMKDSGEGIDPEHLPNVFDAYFTTKQGRHSGLGLHQVQAAVAQLGGDVAIESEVGKGTKVSLYLPRTDDIPEVEEKVAAVPQITIKTDGEPRFRILIVDDDDDVRETIVNQVRDLGHEVTQANSGRQALSLMETASYDLLILDYAMPGMTGMELATRVRVSNPAQKIMFSTGFSNTKALLERHEVILTKPYEEWEIKVKIASAMRETSGPGAQIVQLRRS